MLRGSTRYILALSLLAALALFAGTALAQQRITIPVDTVIQANLDQRLTTRDAVVGQRFTSSLAPADRSGFPLDTRFEGRITEVQRATQDQPGILSMRFDRAILPDGRTASLDGRLASLADEDVRRLPDGRLESRRARGGGIDFRWVGYGAGVGAVIAALTRGNLLRGALLGGVGGLIYAYLGRGRDQGSFREVDLEPGTRFGIRLNTAVAFDHRPGYRYTVRPGVLGPVTIAGIGEQAFVAGERQELNPERNATVTLDGREVDLHGQQLTRLNGTLYVPLAPIAKAAEMRFEHRNGDDGFVLHTRFGPVIGTTGQTVIQRGHNDIDRAWLEQVMEFPPVAIDGQIYVPLEFLATVADMRVHWDAPERALHLERLPV